MITRTLAVRPWMQQLRLPMTNKRKKQLRKVQAQQNKQVVKTTIDAQGRRRVTGGRDLKSTQSYPKAFGLRVARLHSEWVEAFQQIPYTLGGGCKGFLGLS